MISTSSVVTIETPGMKREPSKSTPNVADLLNVGCGHRFHAHWTNLDLDPLDDSVIGHDITRGLPFADDQFAAVYHSHVLEHLTPTDGERLIRECYRVLRPGGVLRIVVPDLEQIARLYLEAHEVAWEQSTGANPDFEWIKLELLDQLVREQSGGQMGRYMSDGRIKNEAFVRSRLGDEFMLCRHHAQSNQDVKTFSARVSHFKRQMTRKLVGWIMGEQARDAFDEGLFRKQGEVHRWMYDRVSLRQLCESVGLEDFQVCDAVTSQIEGFSGFELDAAAGKVRKPDSLFAECIKPVGKRS